MELIYSMRRKPLKCEPPHFDGTTDPEVVRPICTISTCNIIAFSSMTELTDSDGETWGGHVYVCDLDTPWDSHKVTSTVHPVSALEWDNEGKQLLVATTVGEVSVYGQKDYLLNEWTSLYTANFPGEAIKKATFFHNGRRVVALEKKPDAPISDRIQMLRATPTLKGFGGVACGGLCVVTGTGLVGAVTPGDGARAHVAADCLRAVRGHVATASIAHKNGNLLIAAGWRRGSKRGVHCAVCSVARPAAARAAPVALQLQPLPTVYLLDDDNTNMSISWWLRDDIDSLLIAGNNLTVWKMTERAYPVHKLLSKGPVQGSTTPGGGPKAADCFNTVAWQQAAAWQMEGGDSATHVSAARLPLGAHAVLSTPRALHLLARDSHHYLVWRPIVTSGAGAGAPEAAPGAGTPPKKPKYGPGSLPSGASCATVWCAEMSALGGVVVAVDTHSQLHVYKLHQPAPDIRELITCRWSGASCATVWCAEMSALGGVVVAVDTHSQLHVYKLHQPAPDIRELITCRWSGASCATVWCAEMSALGGVVVAVDTHSQLHVYKLHQPAPDIPTPLSVQHVTSLLEYSMVSGYDCLDVLMTLKANIVEAVYERLTESFQRQPPSFQQYYFHSWLKLRIALCSLSASWQSSAASLASLQLCYAAWAACSAALRDDKPDAVAPLTALLDDHTPALPEHDKNLLALEAKAEQSGEGALQALQPLQALRRPLQRALHTALTALAALQPPNLHQLQHHNGYELWSDPAAITLLRKLVVVARACGRGGEALSRPLARLAAGAPPKPDLLEECACVCAQLPARVWDALPRRCVAAPHARGWPLYFEYGVEPESLRYVPEPPAYAQSDIAPSLDMDSIRYMYLGGGRRAARWRRCGRCGARALPAAAPAKHPLQRAYDGRFVAACRCGGKWTLVSNV